VKFLYRFGPILVKLRLWAGAAPSGHPIELLPNAAGKTLAKKLCEARGYESILDPGAGLDPQYSKGLSTGSGTVTSFSLAACVTRRALKAPSQATKGCAASGSRKSSHSGEGMAPARHPAPSGDGRATLRCASSSVRSAAMTTTRCDGSSTIKSRNPGAS
jgi:hypothetical protein